MFPSIVSKLNMLDHQQARGNKAEDINKDAVSSDEEFQPLSIHLLIGKNVQKVLKGYGPPHKKLLSTYKYEWWIYNENYNSYIQFGVINNKIVTILAVGKDVNTFPVKIGESRLDFEEQLKITNKVVIEEKASYYRFNLTEEEMKERPLLQVIDGIWGQFYFDTVTNQLVGVRYLNKDILLMQRPYSLVYRGKLIEPPFLSEKQRKSIESGEEGQILEYTNILRERYGLTKLQWDEAAANTAFNHSKEMKELDYFSHLSPLYGGLEERLEHANIHYIQAGENIAARYEDGFSAVVGWLNSEGHRKTLLNKEFTHLGVGVYEKYYTQNFIKH
ncbi:CAP domain-containing protein [Bacillus taeanensis]|uniref:CAP domain-containing protein n=1 Tax=Bacillus taeanensis TaxID=273032 RepID=A0A366XXE4_9BACI|nr:CAP domain-containing protein [Bacillus taeanensis]RBW70238.1 hypothetical protein DS031_06605 [Bacillus taeanensis]